VPLAFINDLDSTFDEVGAKSVWIRQAGEGAWEKRMCTLQLCFTSEPTGGRQPRPAIIFRGQGVRISNSERAAWHHDVDVSFNTKAWATDDWCIEHIPKQLAPVVPGTRGAEALLLCDNLSGQCSTAFRQTMKTKHNVLVWNLPPGTTDITQPVDSGYGRAVKRLIGVQLAQWMENETNLEKWETGSITASDRRILLTHWVAEAVATVNKNHTTLTKYWERTGCLLTADGSRDDRIHLHPTVELGSIPAYKTFVLPTESTGVGLGLGEGKQAENKDDGDDEVKIKPEDADIVKHDDDELDLDDEDDPDDRLQETCLRDALPSGWAVKEQPPTALNSSLKGCSIAMRWKVAGWCVAKLTRYYSRPKTKLQFNYETRYVLPANELRDHRLQLQDYSTSDDAAYGSWCLIHQEL